MRLLNFSLFCFVLYCYAFVQYCNVKTIQYNAMHKFVGVLDNPQHSKRRIGQFCKENKINQGHEIIDCEQSLIFICTVTPHT